MKVFIIDNYDSFTYNLYQYIGEILQSAVGRGQLDSFSIVVRRNDRVTLAEIRAENPDRLIISPGPGSPDDPAYFGVCSDAILQLGPTIPTLGVCLGMQGITHLFGGRVVRAKVPMHGKVSRIRHDGRGVFANIPDDLEIMRYHSLVAETASFPDSLVVTAAVGDLNPVDFANHVRIRKGGDFEIMGVRHKQHPIEGVQFHPESFASEAGKEMIANFLFGAK